jgi:hypothetical protein
LGTLIGLERQFYKGNLECSDVKRIVMEYSHKIIFPSGKELETNMNRYAKIQNNEVN